MSDETGRALVSGAVTAAALCLGAMGAALLFAGREVGAAVFRRPDVEPLAPLLGGALVGFGAMNWIARRSTLGGIYGKAVVVGNHWHFVVGALVLLKQGVVAGGSAGFWSLTGVYVLGAVLFSYLLFGPGVRDR
jgi:hypothetical protein